MTSDRRKARKEHMAAQHDPINYTCGLCRQVHKFDSKKPYVCPMVDEVHLTNSEEEN